MMNNSTPPVYNFSPGPAMIPQAVMLQAQAEFLNYRGLGVSVMEISHRSSEYLDIANQATQDVKDLLGVPDHYKVLFAQGGASLQFSMVPLNLAGRGRIFDYINTGVWSKKAIDEAGRFGTVNTVADASTSGFKQIPAQSCWQHSQNPAYLHFTPNETIQGLEFHDLPDMSVYASEVPLVADMSSTLFSRPIDVSQFGVIYAGAQKNIGPSGLTLIIVREDLLPYVVPEAPKLLRYETYVEYDSMFNTPPTFAWYMAGLVFRWLKTQGGVAAMAEVNRRKADALYQFIDAHDFYHNPISVEDRSWMNVPFSLVDDSLNGQFLQDAKAAGLLNLKGHRMVGGMRASLYNALPEEAVDRLIEFMKDFAQSNG